MRKCIAGLLCLYFAENYTLNTLLKGLEQVPSNKDMLIPFLDNSFNPSPMFCRVFSTLSL